MSLSKFPRPIFSRPPHQYQTICKIGKKCWSATLFTLGVPANILCKHSPSISFKIPGAPHKAAPDVSKTGSLLERLVVVIHGWQSEPFDGPKGGWSCVFGVVAMVAVVTSPQLLDVVWCNAVVVVVVV